MIRPIAAVPPNRYGMAMVPLSFCGHDMLALADGALFWPRHRALLIADLHLEKASFLASYGQPLPPYDSLATLERLEALAVQTAPARIYCLGDSFHDRQGPSRLDPAVAARLCAMADAVDWIWITGNHDIGASGFPGGRVCVEEVLDGVCLRHEAIPADPRPEISGHWHPKLRIRVRGRSVSRRCFVRSASKLVLPAFGSFTGGLDAGHPALMAAMGGTAEALVPLPDRLLRFAIAA